MSNAPEPYCGNCGYKLTGLTESSKCPECGRPLVEVVSRSGQWGRRYRTKATLFGLPVIDVALGPAPGENVGRARGIIAIGDSATGFVAVGGVARGLVACGGMAIGGFSIGGLSLGVVSAFGGLALGGLVTGGGAVGVYASGGAAAGYMASGGLPIGYYAAGGAPIGAHTIGPGANSAEAAAMFDTMSWFYGGGSPGMAVLQPFLTCGLLTLAAAAAVGLLAILGHLRGKSTDTPAGSR